MSFLTLKTGIYIAILAVAIFVFREYWKPGMCQSKARIDGKIAIITGANTGIGKVTAEEFVKRGAKRVYMACRSVEKGNAAAADITKNTKVKDGQLVVMKLNLASLKSIRDFVKEFKSRETELHLLINNAGIMFDVHRKTEDGFEETFGVNHLGHFLLTNLLLDYLKSSAPSRIINVSSLGHLFATINFDDLNGDKNFNTYTAYGQSKLANILFTKELAVRLEGTGVTAYALHPGAVMTELQRHSSFLMFTQRVMSILWKTPLEGAQTQICCAVSEELANTSGKYYSDCQEKEPSAAAQDMKVAKHLWEVSEELVGLKSSN